MNRNKMIRVFSTKAGSGSGLKPIVKPDYNCKKSIVSYGADKVCFGNSISNYGEVVAGKLYRGSNPDYFQLKTLKQKGMQYVFSLVPDGLESNNVEKLGMSYVPRECYEMGEKPFFGFIVKAANELKDFVEKGAVYVHCQHGQVRTGYLIAAYQKIVQSFLTKRL